MHDDGYTGGVIDSWKQYASSGELFFDIIPGGVASKVEMNAVKSEAKIVDNVIGKNINEVADVKKVNSDKPQWLQNVQNGNAFNKEQSINYPYNEVYIEKPSGGYVRLDSYNPNSGEIVSRKYTQFFDINENTANNYINELANKYPPNAKIANVPSSKDLAGKKLIGKQFLEVPPQVKPIPQSVIDAATSKDIIIRDTNGKVYN